MVEKKCQSNAKTSLCLPPRPVGYLRLLQNRDAPKDKRHRGLLSELVLCLIIAISLWSKDSMRDVLKNLIDGLKEVGLKTGKYWKTPCKAAITKARKRLGQECNEPVVSSIGTTNGYH